MVSELVRIAVAAGGREVSERWDQRLPLVLGRQDSKHEPLGVVHRREDHLRMAIVPYSAIGVSRRQLCLEPRRDGRPLIKNLSPANPVKLGERWWRKKQDSGISIALPITVEVGGCRISLEGDTQTLSQPTRFVSDLDTTPDLRAASALTELDGSETREFVAFLSQVASVLQLSSDEHELCEKACEAVKKLIDVDGVAVLRADRWEHGAGDETLRPHQGALDRVLGDRRVLWKESAANHDHETSPSLECYVVAPIVTKSGEEEKIYGAIYAHRLRGRAKKRTRFTGLHAHLIELVACNLAAGIVRGQQEQQVGRFEQFFTRKLAKKLQKGPDLMKATKKDVSVLFCDIRRFSAVSERLGPEKTSAWVHDVLSVLSECVHDHEGVLVDYVGDELMAMWGAPEDQPDHADRACRAALAMLQSLPELSARYRDDIGGETTVGIGINSGPATVGNTGSRQKFKYGPLGDAVNRASRVQGLTKYLKVPILITGQTHQRLQDDYLARRIGNAKAVNMDNEIELYELFGGPSSSADDPQPFERAIAHLEGGNLHQAAEILAPTLDFRNPDHPSLLAFGAIIDRMLGRKSDEKHQWDFGGK